MKDTLLGITGRPEYGEALTTTRGVSLSDVELPSPAIDWGHAGYGEHHAT